MSRQSIRFRSSGPSLTSGTMRSRYRRHAEAKGLDRKEQKARQPTSTHRASLLNPPLVPLSGTERGTGGEDYAAGFTMPGVAFPLSGTERGSGGEAVCVRNGPTTL